MDSLRMYCASRLDEALRYFATQPELLVDNTFSSDDLVVEYKLGRMYLRLYELSESSQPMFLLASLLESKGATSPSLNSMMVMAEDKQTMYTPQERLPFCAAHMQAHVPVEGRCMLVSISDYGCLHPSQLVDWAIPSLSQYREWGWF